jgi:hypothetical protein
VGEYEHIGEHFVHAAVFTVEHLLKGIVADRRARGVDPLGETHQHVECLAAAAMHVCVAQSGQDLVSGVPGHARKGSAGEAVGERRDAIRKGGEPASVFAWHSASSATM